MRAGDGPEGLAPGWAAAWDEASAAYYYYDAAGCVQWERPAGPPVPVRPGPGPAGAGPPPPPPPPPPPRRAARCDPRPPY